MDSYYKLSEEDQIELWKTQQFSEMGFTGIQTANLLSWNTDLGKARELIAKGCPHDLALLILQPDDAEIDEGTLVLVGSDGQVITVEGV